MASFAPFGRLLEKYAGDGAGAEGLAVLRGARARAGGSWDRRRFPRLAALARQARSGLGETVTFLAGGLQDLRSTGAVAPSSPVLARAMADLAAAEARPGDILVELGPGTGAITRYLLHQARANDLSYLGIEKNAAFARALARKFPMGRFVLDDASNLRDHLPVGGGRVIVVSSLPLRSMRRRDVVAGLGAVAGVLRGRGGALFQYTYYYADPVPQEAGFASTVARKWVLRNLPPATIWECRP